MVGCHACWWGSLRAPPRKLAPLQGEIDWKHGEPLDLGVRGEVGVHAVDRAADLKREIYEKLRTHEVLRRELAASKWAGETVAMGTATDPYQHCEGRYKLTRGIVETITHFANPLSMLTKSTMIVRDLDLYRQLNDVATVTVSMSVGTLDEEVRRVVEPGTPPGLRRLEILAHLLDGLELVGRLLVGERGLELALPHRVGLEGVAGKRMARGGLPRLCGHAREPPGRAGADRHPGAPASPSALP